MLIVLEFSGCLMVWLSEDDSLLDALAAQKGERIVYVSESPAEFGGRLDGALSSHGLRKFRMSTGPVHWPPFNWNMVRGA